MSFTTQLGILEIIIDIHVRINGVGKHRDKEKRVKQYTESWDHKGSQFHKEGTFPLILVQNLTTDYCGSKYHTHLT